MPRRAVKPEALAGVQAHYDFLPASQVQQIVERYLHELWLMELRKNPAIAALAALQPGGAGIPWDRAFHQQGGYVYLQTADKLRARALAGAPKARWRVYHSRQRLSAGADSDLMVKRIA